MSKSHVPELHVTLPGAAEHRRRPGALLVSVAAHALVIAAVVLVVRKAEPWEQTRTPGILGELIGGGGGGGGGERVAYVSLPPASAAAAAASPAVPEPEEVVPPPEPQPEPEPVQDAPEVAVVEPDPQPAVAATESPGAGTGAGEGAGLGPGSGGGTGGGTGGGEGTGTGTGTGPGTGGDGGVGRPPEPRQLILPPLESTPKALRGRTVRVTFWVHADGTVERITVEPRIEDRDYARKFEEAMVKYRFRPARDAEGRPTTGTLWIDVDLTSR